jgi:hypothetical protein
MKIKKLLLISVGSFLVLIVNRGCYSKLPEEPAAFPTEVPRGILVDRIPSEADVLFVSMRYVLGDPACLDDSNHTQDNFLDDPDCLREIYNPDLNVLASPRQLYALDIETDTAVQLTNLECDFSSSKPIDSTRIMAPGTCSDTDGDGVISTKDKPEIFVLDLANKDIQCLTCGLALNGINNPDYSPVNQQFLFSAQWADKFHNYIFTLDWEGNLDQLTNTEEYMDFDCSWSEDGKKIVFNRLPEPFMTIPSEVWLMDATGINLEQITEGGPNPNGEEPLGSYPMGIDADPDLSPDNSQIVFSRLRTGKHNEPFGIYELDVIDLNTKEITILDSEHANMVPEWKEGGILFIRQTGSLDSWMERKQSVYLYRDGEFINLEPEFDEFPIGSNGASWAR